MTTENNDWVLMSERKPTEGDLPIYYYCPAMTSGVWFAEKIDDNPEWCIQRPTHWKRATLPAPPPRAKSQREEDDEACYEWVRAHNPHNGFNCAWHAALAYRDAQNRADLEEIRRTFQSSKCAVFVDSSEISRLRKRAGLDA